MEINMNPFGIGPVGAVFLTVFVCLTVIAVASIWCYTTWRCVRCICITIDQMWKEIDQLARDLNPSAPAAPHLLREPETGDKGA